MKKPLPAHGHDIEITQPITVDITTVDGVFIRQMVVRNAGTFCPQHSHVFDHTTMLAKGQVFLWRDGCLDQRYAAPAAIVIKAGVKHLFQSLVDDTILYCIHNLHGAEMVQLLAEHIAEYV
jgi:quercetin dioxygenase-like cupin family protein